MACPAGDDTGNLAGLLRSALAAFPRVELGLLPTPLQRLARLGSRAGHGSLWVKRDDLIGLGFGGNKVRNLEYLLGDALHRGVDTVIACGGLQSNLCRLAAAACARLGLRCILLHNDNRPAFYQGNMLLNHLAGAETLFLGPVDETRRAAAAEDLAARLSRRGRRPYVIRNGGTTPLGALGFVQAALELWEQSQQEGVQIAEVAMVGAMGGTAAGFVLGAALLGRPFHVRVISVEYRPELLSSLIQGIAAGAAALLGSREPSLWRRHAAGRGAIDRAMTVYGGYLGPGYAVPTPDCLAAVGLAARSEGLFLETVYTGKTLAGCLDLIRRGVVAPQNGCCYWHTGGTPALFAQAETLQPLGDGTP